jgi:tetratricopeptide (TPR) repeat protein
MGVLHRKRGEAREAISGFLEAVRFDPDHAKAWLSLAALYRACGREADALDALRELLRLKPGLAAAWCDLGNLHARRGQHEKAGTAFRQAIQVKPEYAGAWLGLGRSCVALGNASGLAEVLHTLRTLAAPLADLLEREAGTPPRVAEPAQPAASGPSARSSPRPAPPRTAASFEPWLKSLRRAKAGAKAPARPRARSRRASARIA